ncbi:MAG: prepilin-type N-terminal cleavage/methylation domain-containing protein [Planctomycetes bacterium]|nr:prepilin-type N-terminal cleavage/methylation domain-containing protein [Planctomycetota bacterium]
MLRVAGQLAMTSESMMNVKQKSPRPGFTMIELMVVITIIALLMSLSIGAMFSFIAGAREAATATTIAKVNKLLQERVEGLRQMDFTDAAQRFSDTNGGSVQLSEVIVRKFRMKRAFPQNLAEALGNDPQRYSALSALSSPPTTYVPKYESGIVLYAMLTNGETFGAASVGDDVFMGSEVRNSPETANLPCLVDAWGEPLRFYRWPTRLFKPSGPVGMGTTLPLNRTFAALLVSNVGRSNGYGADGLPGANGLGGQGAYGSDDIPNVGPDGAPGIAGTDDDGDGNIDNATELGWPGSDDYEPLNNDADDPLMRLASVLNNSNAILQFEQGSTSGTPNLLQALHTPFTYAPMLVVSAGPDRQLGLLEPNDTSTDCGYLACPTITANGATLTQQYLTDNITNLNQSSSGK